jgi:hypothetical protein
MPAESRAARQPGPLESIDSDVHDARAGLHRALSNSPPAPAPSPYRRLGRMFAQIWPRARLKLPAIHKIITPRLRTPTRNISEPAKPECASSTTSYPARPAPIFDTAAPRPPQPNEASYTVVLPAAPALPREENIFLVDAPVAIYRGGYGIAYDDIREAVVLYDSGIEEDIMSTAYLGARRNPADTMSRRTFAMSISGAAFDYVDEVEIRWKDPNFTRYRFLETRCLVVESDFFDIIIGRKTIQRLQLYVRNSAPVAGPTITPRPLLDSKDSTAVHRSTS